MTTEPSKLESPTYSKHHTRSFSLAPLQPYARAGLAVAVLFLNLTPVPPQSPLLKLAAVLAFAWVGLEFLILGARIERKHLALLLLIVLLAIGLVLNPPGSAYGQIKSSQIMTAGMASAAVMLLLRTEKDVRTFAWFTLALATSVSVGTFAGGEFSQGRASAFDSNPIWSARGLVAGIICASWLLIWQKRHRGLLVISLVVCTLGGLRLDSRFALLAVLSGLILLVVSSRGPRTAYVTAIRQDRPLFTFVATLTVAGLAVLWFGGPRISQLLGNPWELVDGEVRIQLWANARDLWLASPGGIGVGEFQSLSYFGWIYSYPHNFYLEALMEMGTVVGLGLIGFILFTLIRAVINPHRSGPSALAAGLLGSFVVAVNFSGDMNARVFYALIVFAWVAQSIPQEAVNDPVSNE